MNRVWGGGGARTAARFVACVLSLLVVVATGYGWVELHQLSGALTRAQVIGPRPGVSPDVSAPLAAGQPGAGADPAGGAAALGAAEENILLVGLDARTDALGNPLPAKILAQLHAGASGDGGDSADTLIVVHIPAGGGSATAISIPRDSYVSLADGFGEHKINSAYAYGKHAAQNRLREQELRGAALDRAAAQAGARTVIDTVQRLTGLDITHYAALNLVGFYQLSQALGGVPVCLVAPAHDPDSGVDLSAGWHNLRGAQALAFVRQRHGLPAGDLDRIRHQQVFLASLAHQMLSANTLADPAALRRLAGALGTSLTVDQGFNLVELAGEFHQISAGNIRFTTIPTANPALPTPDGTAVKVSPERVHAFVSNLDLDLDLDADLDTGATPDGSSSSPSPALNAASATPSAIPASGATAGAAASVTADATTCTN